MPLLFLLDIVQFVKDQSVITVEEVFCAHAVKIWAKLKVCPWSTQAIAWRMPNFCATFCRTKKDSEHVSWSWNDHNGKMKLHLLPSGGALFCPLRFLQHCSVEGEASEQEWSCRFDCALGQPLPKLHPLNAPSTLLPLFICSAHPLFVETIWQSLNFLICQLLLTSSPLQCCATTMACGSWQRELIDDAGCGVHSLVSCCHTPCLALAVVGSSTSEENFQHWQQPNSQSSCTTMATAIKAGKKPTLCWHTWAKWRNSGTHQSLWRMRANWGPVPSCIQLLSTLDTGSRKAKVP